MTRHVPYDITSALEETPADGSAPAVDGQAAGGAELPQQVGKGGETAAEPGHFDTEHLLADLKGRSIRGGAVTLGAQGIKFALNLVSVVVLARLLTPADFGLVAMVTALTGFVAMFKNAGLSMATVQREQINHAQVSTLFWINVALSFILMCVVAALAPVVAWFYGEPELVWVTLAIAATFILGGLTPQHKALLKRQMRFTAMAVKDITAMACGIAVAITLAYLGAGYWALVAMGAASSLVGVIMVWSLTGWIPGLPRRGTGIRPMLAFGGFLTGSSFVGYIRRNLDNVLIGAAFGPVALGFYQKAYQILTLPIQQANRPMTHVVIPALSRLQNRPDRYRRFYQKSILLLTSLGLPIAGFAFVAAELVVLLILGDQWLDAVPLFMALVPAAFAGTLNGVSAWVFLSLGRANRHFQAQVFATVVVVVALVAGLPWGPLGIAIGFSVGYCTILPIVIHWSHRDTLLTMTDVLASVWPPALATLLGATFALATRLALQGEVPVVLELAVIAAAFGTGYLLIFAMLPHRHVLIDTIRAILLRNQASEA